MIKEGASSDRTRLVVEGVMAADPRVKLIDNPRGTAPAALSVRGRTCWPGNSLCTPAVTTTSRSRNVGSAAMRTAAENAQVAWGTVVTYASAGNGSSGHLAGELLKLRDAGCALLIVSEELDELFEICDRLAVIATGLTMFALFRYYLRADARTTSAIRACQSCTVRSSGTSSPRLEYSRNFCPSAVRVSSARNTSPIERWNSRGMEPRIFPCVPLPLP